MRERPTRDTAAPSGTALLYASGRLPEGYRHGAGGFDELLTGSLGIDNAAFVAYIENEKPGYLQLEAWVKEHESAREKTMPSRCVPTAPVSTSGPAYRRKNRWSRLLAIV